MAVGRERDMPATGNLVERLWAIGCAIIRLINRSEISLLNSALALFCYHRAVRSLLEVNKFVF